MYELLRANAEPLSRILTVECGKPLSEAVGEINYSASYFKWFAEEGRRTYGDVIPPPISHRRVLVLKSPIGVCGIITPWNFPMAMIARKVAPALVTGCSMVIKPAHATPLSALALAQIAEEAGVPQGVLNVVTTLKYVKDVGNELCENKMIRKLSFTGSTNMGMHLSKLCASTLKRMSLELGGNAPFIVFDDADVDSAVEGAMVSKFRNSGQTCVCANRFYIHRKVYDEFLSKFTDKVKKLKIGHGFHKGVHIGPLITDDALSKVEAHVKDAVQQVIFSFVHLISSSSSSLGAEVVTGGKRANVEGFEKGAFYQPTILTKTSSFCLLSKEETFGPVAPIFQFDNDEEVLQLANDTDAGLASYFYTKNAKRLFNVAEKLEYGMVGINTGLISSEVAPFGGVKYSGTGREGSKYGIDDYLDIKYKIEISFYTFIKKSILNFVLQKMTLFQFHLNKIYFDCSWSLFFSSMLCHLEYPF
ncbi:succinate semialdehyde dehydrogenase [Reticulomyxa filosa]|uniref:Succinate-semialdehyde dehydrogenase, mitochondrial n=1 Tax=Reticulomyxa filosa TaxID=46433 RepID=X6M9X2_RETFI|nr:succinate semialdehyde dehydrogenase [Reticulomyxa filosa]|eukprot:ETO10277.1 succinate semialdehyde dehydrogenase [Reticulomyxa filosa]